MARLQTLKIQNLRNIKGVELGEFSLVNIFYGANGAGKTSVLEAVHLLGLARSFRMARHKPLIAYDCAEAVVFGQVRGSSESAPVPVGVRRCRGGQHEIRLRGQRIGSAAELASLLPLQVISSDTFQLVLGAPGLRRQFMDWGVFHVEHGFLDDWRRLQRSLKQRNSLLRRGKIDSEELVPWTLEFLQASHGVTTERERYFTLWHPVMRDMLQRLWPEGCADLEFNFHPGWDGKYQLGEVLERQARRDREQGYTTMGPQRADVHIRHRGLPVGDVLSRGQLKLLSAAMRLAQAAVLDSNQGRHCVFLVDDLPSELDEERRALLCSLLVELRSQVFITSVDKQSLVNSGFDSKQLSMFHVEHGSITKTGQCG